MPQNLGKTRDLTDVCRSGGMSGEPGDVITTVTTEMANGIESYDAGASKVPSSTAVTQCGGGGAQAGLTASEVR
jgi:hypothetical protein